MIRAAAKTNQTLDIEKFERDMFLLKLRLGFYNKRKIQENKIGMLSQELVEAKRERIYRRRSLRRSSEIYIEDSYEDDYEPYLNSNIKHSYMDSTFSRSQSTLSL